MPGSTSPAAAAAGSGWRARLELDSAAAGGTTRLVHNRHEGPLRLLKALASDDGRVLEAVIVHPPGGLAGGDDLRVDLAVGPGCRVLATTPGAQKWYRADRSGGAVSAQTRLRIAAGAVLEWLPQPSILYDHADARQDLRIDLAGDAGCIGWEMLIRGRAAMGERFAHGAIDQSITMAVDGLPLWRERLKADAADRLFPSPVGWDGRTVAASVWCCAPAWSPARLALLRDAWRELATPGGGATVIGDALVLARLLGDDGERLQATCQSMWRAARISLDGEAGSLPRIWRT